MTPEAVAFRSGLGETQTYVAQWYAPPAPSYWAQWRTDITHATAPAPGHPYAFRLLYGQDFYSLSTYTVAAGTWLAFQFHDPQYDIGAVLVYRRAGTPTAAYTTRPLGGLVPGHTYCFSSWDGPGGAAVTPARVAGSTLTASGAAVVVPAMPGAGVFTYVAC